MLKNKEKNFISAVLYVHNQENQITQFIHTLNELLKQNFEQYEIICVNDASSDNSLNAIKNACEKIKGTIVSVVNMGFFQGIELSMNAGVDLAIGDFVFEFDSIDQDYQTNLIMDVYYHSLKGYDIVSAAPKKYHAKSSRAFYWIFNKFANMPNKITTESFRVLSRRAINRIHSINTTTPYRKAIYASAGLKIDTLEYQNTKTSTYQEKKASSTFWQSMALDSIMLFTNFAFRLSFALALIMMGITIFMAIYALYFALTGTSVEGWATTILFLAFGFFSLFLILTIIIKYLSLMLDLIFKKERYYIQSVEKITKQ
jgi:dolichol-phosphate mannosyltransferase